MTEYIRFLLTQHIEEVISLCLSLLVLTIFVSIIIFLFHRRQFKRLKHKIPAIVVNDYLDTVIDHSNALKKTLFRGNHLKRNPEDALKLDSNITPLRIPGEQGDGNQAELTELKNQLANKKNIIKELEEKLANQKGKLQSSGDSDAEEKITKLKQQLEVITKNIVKKKKILK